MGLFAPIKCLCLSVFAQLPPRMATGPAGSVPGASLGDHVGADNAHPITSAHEEEEPQRHTHHCSRGDYSIIEGGNSSTSSPNPADLLTSSSSSSSSSAGKNNGTTNDFSIPFGALVSGRRRRIVGCRQHNGTTHLASRAHFGLLGWKKVVNHIHGNCGTGISFHDTPNNLFRVSIPGQSRI